MVRILKSFFFRFTHRSRKCGMIFILVSEILHVNLFLLNLILNLTYSLNTQISPVIFISAVIAIIIFFVYSSYIFI